MNDDVYDVDGVNVGVNVREDVYVADLVVVGVADGENVREAV